MHIEYDPDPGTGYSHTNLKWFIGEPVPVQLLHDKPKSVKIEVDGNELALIVAAMQQNLVVDQKIETRENLTIVVSAMHEVGAVSGHRLDMVQGGLTWFHYHEEPIDTVARAISRGITQAQMFGLAIQEHYNVTVIDSRIQAKQQRILTLQEELTRLETEVQIALAAQEQP